MQLLLRVFAIALAATTVASKLNALQHSGPASPYFDAPASRDVEYETPEGCIVDQAAYILRHGSRYPEPGSFNGWRNLYYKIQNASFTARGSLSFLPDWNLADMVDDEPQMPLYLTSTGALESFELGVDLRKRYKLTPGGNNFTLWAASQQRCVDSAVFFARGYVSQGNYLATPNRNRVEVLSLADSTTGAPWADSLTPSSSCPAYSPASANGSAFANAYRDSYRPQVAERLNRLIHGDLVLDATDVGVMQDLCGFGFEVSGERRFCDVFTDQEWLDYEYAHDLNYFYGSGPGNALSATVGWPWVKALADIFAAGPGQVLNGGDRIPPPLIMGFTHDNNLPPVLSALGLWNGTLLSPTRRDPRREFRSSHVVSFRGYVALERLACSSSSSHDSQDEGTFVRIRVNRAPVPIPACKSGPGASCPLGRFVDYVQERQEVAGVFQERCGLADEEGVESEVGFLTQLGNGEELLVGLN